MVMSQSKRRRGAGLAVAALLAGGPLLAAAPAYAGPAESGSEVVFNGGGLLGVSCAARPNRTSVAIRAETTLRVVNNTGYRATLVLDGAARGEIGKGSAAEVLFHRGPVILGLKPNCVLGEQSTVRVQVLPALSDTPGAGTASPSAPTQTGARTNIGSERSDAAGASPTRHAPDGRPSAGAPPTAAVPADAGSSPDDRGIIGDGTAAPDAAAVAGATGTESEAAEPMASVEPLTNRGPIGLLALIATVCVFGVSAGAMRVILAQRASRTAVA
jgi:hypothetical protein